jgi:hypothetical protein
MKLIYVAGAYTSNPLKNMEIAEKASIDLIRNGFAVFTPHKNFYDYQKYEDVDYETYLQIDFDIISRCDAVYVLDNWNESPGTKREIEYCISVGIPVLYQSVFNARDLLPESVSENKEEEIRTEAIKHYGKPAQVLKCIEELAELQIELIQSLDTMVNEENKPWCHLHQIEQEARCIWHWTQEINPKDITMYDDIRVDKIVSELADVSITTSQMKKIFTTSDEFEKVKQAKLSRLVERMNGDGDSQ